MARALRILLPAATLLLHPAPAAVSVGIGELVLHSHWGEAIQATVPLVPSAGESLSEACLTLGRPPAEAADADFYLTRARLSLEQTATGPVIRIAGRNLWREPVAKVVLRVGCGDAPATQREFALLLDLPIRPPTLDEDAPRAMPGAVAADTGAIWPVRPGDTLLEIAKSVHPDDPRAQKALVAATVRANPQQFPGGQPRPPVPGTVLIIPDLKAAAAARTRPPAPPALRIAPALNTTGPPVADAGGPPPASRRSLAGGFQLRLSAEPVDLSRLGSVTEKERGLLRERQQLMEADDQTARFLELRHRIAELEREIDQLRRDAKRAASPPPAPKPADEGWLSAERRELLGHALNLYLLPAAQITLAALALFFVIRHYRNIRARLAAQGLLFRRSVPPRRQVLVESPRVAEPVPPFDREVAIATAGSAASDWDPANMDIILHDAQLYVVHGHADRAIELLEEQIAANRGEVRVWMLLFVICRSQGMIGRYERLARRFRDLAPDPQMWRSVQELGREIDADNPLYGEPAARSAPPADATIIAAEPIDLDLSEAPTGTAAAGPRKN